MEKLGNNSREQFIAKFSLGDTGIAQDYFNHTLVTNPEVIFEPKRYGGEDKVRAIIIEGLKNLKTYNEYIRDFVANHNSPMKDCDGNIIENQRPIKQEDFFTEENADKIKQLEQIITEMKKMKATPENLNLRTLLDPMYQAALLIYGVKYEEKLKKRFKIT